MHVLANLPREEVVSGPKTIFSFFTGRSGPIVIQIGSRDLKKN